MSFLGRFIMKHQVLAIYALCGLLLAGCASRQMYGPKHEVFGITQTAKANDYKRIFTEGADQVTVTAKSEASQVFWVAFTDHAVEKKDCYQVNPGGSYQEMHRSNDKLRATIIYYPQGANDDLSSPRREVKLHFPLYAGQTLVINDLLLQERNLQEGFFSNSYHWAGILSDDRGNNYGLLQPLEDTGLIQLASGPIVLKFMPVEGPYREHVYRFPFEIDHIRNEVVYQGKLVDFTCDVYDRRYQARLVR